MARFAIGKEYYPVGDGFDPITVTYRTEKTVWVNNGVTGWRMLIRTDENGDEYAIDSSCRNKRYREALTFHAKQRS